MALSETQTKAEEIALGLIAERCKVDLYYLCKYILGGEEVLDPKVHGPLCRAMRPLLMYKDPTQVLEYEFPSDYGREEEEGLPTEAEMQEFFEWQEQFEPSADAGNVVGDKFDHKLNQLLALMPRGTLKSTVITIGFTIQWHLNFPEDRVLIDSETYTKACAFLTEIRGHYEANLRLRQVFYYLYGVMPDANQKKDAWATTMVNLACRTRKRKEPSIDCAGIDVTKNGMHYDLVIMDDLHSEKNTTNADQIEQVKKHYRLVFSLLDPGKSAAVVGTRWDDSDLYQMIIDEEQEEFNFITRAAENVETGALFYPKRLDKKQLNIFRKKQGGYLYSCQYLNNPVDDETATFKREMFSYRTMKDIENLPINWYGLVDPSFKGPYSDYCAIIIGGVDSNGEVYCRYVWREKATYSELIDKMYEVDALFPGVIKLWRLEVIGTKTLEHDLEQAQLRAAMAGKSRLKVRTVRSYSNSKEDRIKAMAPYYERGHAHHIKGCPQLNVLETELVRFPKSKNDDASDAWSGILTTGARPRANQSDKDVQKRKKLRTMLSKPRSPMVGY